MSPTQRTLAALREKGYRVGIVERWVPMRGHPGGGIRKDLFGIIDIICMTEEGILGVQSTGTGYSEHMRKLKGEGMDACVDWLLTPGTALELWGWRKLLVVKADGKKGKARKYAPRVHRFTLQDFVG